MDKIRTDWEYEINEEDNKIVVYKVLNASEKYKSEKDFIIGVVGAAALTSAYHIIPQPGLETTDISKKVYYIACNNVNSEGVEEYLKSKGLEIWYVDTFDKFKSKVRNNEI